MASDPLIPYASKWRGRRVGLYGGSFNPAHKGHSHVARTAIRHLKLDALWILVSPGNPLKDDDHMAPFEARMLSAKTTIEPHPKLSFSTIECELGSRYTSDLVIALLKSMPTTQFVWVMGADNLQQFSQWHAYDTIAKSVPIAVFDRPGYSARSLSSEFARKYQRFYRPARTFPKDSAPAWTFVQIPRHAGSATDIRRSTQEDWWQGDN